jgi:ISXO2-like transposase domain
VVCAFSLCKRGLTGAFHKVSLKHLQRYLNVFSYRFNNRKDANLFGMTVRRMALAGNLRALEVCVLRFYSRIFWSAASDYKSVNAKLQVVGAIALSAIELLKPSMGRQNFQYLGGAFAAVVSSPHWAICRLPDAPRQLSGIPCP